jgi:hypothetical protein
MSYWRRFARSLGLSSTAGILVDQDAGLQKEPIMSAPKVRRYTNLPTDLESALDMIEEMCDQVKRSARIMGEGLHALDDATALVEKLRREKEDARSS